MVPSLIKSLIQCPLMEKKYDIYDSGRTLPLVFPYSSAVTREDFDKLPVERRQQLLLEKAVIEEKNGIPAELFTEADGIYEETVPNTKFKCKKGCELKEDSLIVKKSGAEVKVTADCSLDGELYVVFENLEYENLPSESFFDGISKTDWQIKINVSQGKLKKNVVVQNKKGLGGYCNRHDFLCNLEYQKAGKKEIVLKFPYEGIYKFKDIRVVSQPTKVLEDSIKEWENRVQGSFYQEGNCMISDIELKANSVVCFGIPYDKGWKVTVDGEENKALLGNLAYLAVPLKKGSHQLVFEYTNPYLKLGMLVSLGGTAVFLIYIWLNEKRCKKIIGKFEKTC